MNSLYKILIFVTISIIVGCGKDRVVTVVPAVPSNLIVDANSPTSIKITWIDNSDNETSFEIERENPALTNSWISVTRRERDATLYNHVGLNETWPGYRIRSINSAGNSQWTAVSYAPPKLRVINNLYDGQGELDWSEKNKIVILRIGPTATSVVDGGNQYERLFPSNVASDVMFFNEVKFISPKYLQTTSYEDFELGQYPEIGNTYYLYLQCGWWDLVILDNTTWFERRPTNVKDVNGNCCVFKWAWKQMDNHFSGYIVITSTDLGLVHGSWDGSM